MTVVSPEFGVVSVGSYSPVTVTAKSSAESNFRELDDAFLQTQTRIWLGEVLQIRFDEETDISDILADGKLLSELSEVLSSMLPSLSIDTTQPKTNEWKSFVSSKSTQRYMPYYNVGSFLKMCKNLGLDGIDLFTPSDVVEKRNTRKVCMCMRSLSKRASSRDLNVPDFDSVTCTLTMPTNMVECIRKSLEMSQSSSSLSVGLEADKASSVRCWNKISNSASIVSISNECSSDIRDDAESSFVVGEFNGPSDYTYDPESPLMSCSEVIAIGDYSPALQLNMRDVENEEDDQCEYLSPSNGESVGSPCSQYFSDQEIGMPSSDCLGSHITGKVGLNIETKPLYQNGDLLHIPINWGDDLDFEKHSDDHANNDGSNCGSRDKQDTGICVTRSENQTHPSEIGSEKGSCSSMEQVSCTNSIALGGDVDVACELFLEDGFGTSKIVEEDNLLEDSDIARHEPELVISESFCDRKEDSLLQGNDVSLETDSSLARYYKETFEDNKTSSDHTEHSNHDVYIELAKDNKMCSENTQETWVIPEDCRPLDTSDNVEVIDIADALVKDNVSTTLDDPQLGIEALGSMEDTGHKRLQCVEEDIEKGKTEHIQEGATKDLPRHKPQRKLLKSVIKGTALLGVTVFLLHLRKNRQDNLSQIRKQPVEVLKQSTPPPSPKKGQKGGKASSVYPAGKLNFGF